MTLLDLATFICTKVNQSEAEDLDACKSFLKRRLDMIWADQLWHDALFEYTQTLSATGYDVNSTWLPTKQVLLLPVQFSHPVAVRTSTQKMSVLSSEELYRMDYNTFENSGTPIRFRVLSQCVWEFDVVESIAFPGTDADAGKTITVDYLDLDGVSIVRVQKNVPDDNAIAGVLRIDAIRKDATAAQLLFSDYAGNGTQFLSLAATDTAAPKCCRLQLFGSIPDGAVIRVLGKTKCPAFTEDGDEPALVGVENALLAFGQADMLQRERQYGKAQVLQQEGQLLLEQLKKVRTVQQAHNKRLIPDSGYGDDYGLLSGSLFTV